MIARALAGRVVAPVAGLLLLVVPVLWQLDPGRLVSGRVNLQQFATAELVLALLYIFASRVRSGRPGWQNALLLLAALGAVAVGWLLVQHHGSARAQFILPTPRNIALSLALGAMVLGACWMTSGRHFVLLIGLFLGLGFAAQFLQGPMAAPPVSAERYTVYMTLGAEGFLGNALRVIAQVVVVFIGFGVLASLIGATAVIEKVALLATHRSRGAAIKVAVLSSALFGTISGSATSNVMTSGTFSITSMRRLGLSGAQAGGVEAVASTLGQVIPPIMGAAAFLMADFTGLSYLTIAAAAALPALLCVAVLFFNADRMARAVQAGAPGAAPGQAPGEPPGGHGLCRADLLYLLPVAGIFATLILRPDRVGLAGVAGLGLCLLAGLLRNGPAATFASFRALPAMAGRAIGNLVVTASALGCIIAVLAITGYDVLLTMKIGQLGEANLFLSLLLCALTAIILGMGMATSGVYIVVAIMLAPGLVKLGIPVLAAHMFVFYFSVISMITPPVAFAVLAASGLSGAGFYRTALAALRFGWVLFVMPFLMIYFPGLLLLGGIEEIARDLALVLAAGLGLWALANAPALLARSRARRGPSQR